VWDGAGAAGTRRHGTAFGASPRFPRFSNNLIILGLAIGGGLFDLCLLQRKLDLPLVFHFTRLGLATDAILIVVFLFLNVFIMISLIGIGLRAVGNDVHSFVPTTQEAS
jgi:hypothetical protein